jgi:hypothetical protein
MVEEIRYPNGDIYLGNVDENGKKTGLGKMTFIFNKITFINHIPNHIYERFVFEGEFFEDQIHGYGKLTYPNDTTYEGYWIQNIRQPSGIKTYRNGDIYQGICRMPSLSIPETNERKLINLSEVMENGIGQMIYTNGDVYEGNWSNGKCHGEGKMTFSNGDIYKGNWHVGKRDGIGKMIYITGTEIWEQGVVYEG